MTVDCGQAAGLTVDSFVSLSLEPPLVGVALRRHAALHELLREAGVFAISILAAGQEHLAQHFARGVPPIAHWPGSRRARPSWSATARGALGWIECRLASEHEPGDHTFFVGEVRRRGRAGTRGARPPAAGSRDRGGRLRPRRRAPRHRAALGRGRREIAEERGGRWHDDAQRAMMGMSSPEWSRYMHDVIGARRDRPSEIAARSCGASGELLPAATAARSPARSRRSGGSARAGRSGSPRRRTAPLIDLFLEPPASRELFRATVSSEEVARGKPAPDVYLEAARRLGVAPGALRRDRGLGERHPLGAAAGMRVRRDPEPPSSRRAGGAGAADVVLDSLGRAHARGDRELLAAAARRNPPEG